MLKCAVQVIRWRDTRAHRTAICTRNRCTHYVPAPGRSLNYPRPKSITHLRTFSDNGVYVALQLFLAILVSDQRRRVLHLTILVAAGSNPRPLDYQANLLPLSHSSLYSLVHVSVFTRRPSPLYMYLSLPSFPCTCICLYLRV